MGKGERGRRTGEGERGKEREDCCAEVVDVGFVLQIAPPNRNTS